MADDVAERQRARIVVVSSEGESDAAAPQNESAGEAEDPPASQGTRKRLQKNSAYDIRPPYMHRLRMRILTALTCVERSLPRRSN